MSEQDQPVIETGSQIPNSATTVLRDEIGERLAVPGANGGTLYPFRKGQVGNPAGRPNASTSVREWFNALEDTPEDELEQIARDRCIAPKKRAAAIQWLRVLADTADMADFEPLVDGRETTETLKNQGAAVRKLKKVRRRESKSGTTTEIELSEQGGEALDRIMDRTGGRPSSDHHHHITGQLGIAVLSVDQIRAELRAIRERGDSRVMQQAGTSPADPPK